MAFQVNLSHLLLSDFWISDYTQMDI